MSFESHPDDPWFVRTHFADDTKWSELITLATAPTAMMGEEFFANLNVVEDAKFAGLSPVAVVNALPDNYPQYFVLVADALSHADDPTVLVVNFLPQAVESYDTRPSDRTEQYIESFRAVPDALQSITNNLSIANMDFEEFAKSVDDDGVFRRFPGPN